MDVLQKKGKEISINQKHLSTLRKPSILYNKFSVYLNFWFFYLTYSNFQSITKLKIWIS